MRYPHGGFCFETPLRDHIKAKLFGKQFLRFANRTRLIDESKTSPQGRFPKMRQQNVGFAAPGFDQEGTAAKRGSPVSANNSFSMISRV
ncbi:MAG: hypothetical protein AAES65_02310 [Candidatus Thiodiazotropha sp. (ex. Lucinoma kazani)]